MSTMPTSARVPAIYVISDVSALLVFVVVGMRSHHGGSYLAVFLRNAIPLLASWAAVAIVLGTYRPPGGRGLARQWIIAVPLGVTARSLWVGSPDDLSGFVTFLGVALAFTMLFLLVGRGLVMAGVRWRQRGAGRPQ